MSGYSETMRKHFREPRNVGSLEHPDGFGRAENIACGDVLEISFRLEGERVARACFRAQACSAVIATASLATEAVTGMSTAEAAALDVDLLVERAGGVPPSKRHAPRVVERALRAALDDAAGRG